MSYDVGGVTLEGFTLKGCQMGLSCRRGLPGVAKVHLEVLGVCEGSPGSIGSLRRFTWKYWESVKVHVGWASYI